MSAIGYSKDDLPNPYGDSNYPTPEKNTAKALWAFSIPRNTKDKHVIYPCIGEHWFNDEQLKLLTAIGIETRCPRTYRHQGYAMNLREKLVSGEGTRSNPLMRLQYLNALNLWPIVATAIAEDPSRLEKWIQSSTPDVEDMIDVCMLDSLFTQGLIDDLRMLFVKTGAEVWPRKKNAKGELVSTTAASLAGVPTAKSPTGSAIIIARDAYVSKKNKQFPFPMTRIDFTPRGNQPVIESAIEAFLRTKENKKSGVANKVPLFAVSRSSEEKEASSGGKWLLEESINLLEDDLGKELLEAGVFVKLSREWLAERLTSGNNYYLNCFNVRNYGIGYNGKPSATSFSIDEIIQQFVDAFGLDDGHVVCIPVIPDLWVSLLPQTDSQVSPLLSELVEVASRDSEPSQNVSYVDSDIPF